ncbi:MAG: amidase [Bacteroidetes bacterium]|nr:MAG: amidase [Bacteroidota bacterium]
MKRFLKKYLFIIGGIILFTGGALVSDAIKKFSAKDVQTAQKFISVNFSEMEADSMLDLLALHKENFDVMRTFPLSNSIPPAFIFNPIPIGKKIDLSKRFCVMSDYDSTILPADINELAYFSIGQLAHLIKTKKITSEKLTAFFLDRLKKHSPALNCVITYTDELALLQAKQADKEISAGIYRGVLHGIPYGIKDMFATKNYPTSFGTPPFRDQLINEDATVVKKLQDAGAVLIAKLSLGELAMDDIWFGGQTRNPWDTIKGSSGSSAGPAAAVAAGLVPFAIGSETWGSIVSPATACGVTGLRPTFGRVSRSGAMALSWTMDKIGPLCRNVEDCAMVLNAIAGIDPKDPVMIDVPFNYDPIIDLTKLKIGFFPDDFAKDTSINKPYNMASLEYLKNMGVELIPLKLPDLPVNDMSLLLECEVAAAFEELTLTNRDDEMVQQNKNRWPNYFRAAHFIPATEYIRANRLRYLLIQEMDRMMSRVDLCIAPSLAGDNLLITNLTGHPSIVIPNGFINESSPTSIVFIGQLYEEGKLLSVAKKYQDKTAFHLIHPPLFK